MTGANDAAFVLELRAEAGDGDMLWQVNYRRAADLIDRYRKALEIIAGQPQHVLEAMQARAALDNIGGDGEQRS